jgi:hypothetical protein
MYRGTLSRLVHREQLEIRASATEGECLRLVSAERPAPEAGFFRHLTRLWIELAYDHRLPEHGEVSNLCRDWESLWGQEGGGVD